MESKLLIMAPKKLSETTKMLIESAKQHQFDVIFVPIKDVVIEVNGDGVTIHHDNKDLLEVDYFLPRIDGKRASFGYKIVRAFDETNVPHPYPANTLKIAHDKFLTSITLSSKNIPVPKTYAINSVGALEKMLNTIRFPAVVKLLSGSGGKGVMFVENEEQLLSVCRSVEEFKQEIIVQEFVENEGYDIRILTLGYEAVAGMKRIAQKGEKRANVSSGGKAVSYEASDEIRELAIKVAKALRAEILAVDIIVDKEGNPWVLEVNVNPGIQGLMKATDKDIPKMIVNYIKDVVKG